MKARGKFANMNSGALCTSDMKQVKYKLFYAFLCLVMLFWFAVVVFPCLWLAVSGFKTAAEINASKNVTFFPKEFNLHKVVEAWNTLKYSKFYLNTFFLAIGCVISDLIVSGLAGYVLSRLRPKGYKAILSTVFCLMILPATGTTVPIYITFKNAGLLNTYWPMWLMAGANMFNIILFKTNFDGVSNSLIEAAKIDGASNMKIFLRIIIPLSMPVIMTVALFTFNGQFGNFFWPNIVLTNPQKYTLGVQVYRIQQQGNVPDDIKMMGIIFSVAPQVIIFALFQKQIIGGMNLGGVKG